MDSNQYLFTLPAFAGASAKQMLSSVLTGTQAATLRSLAMGDATGVFYSGLISLAQGIAGLNGRRYGWSTVKLYYSTFYFLRAYLLAQGWCQFYVEGKPRAIDAQAGASPVCLSGTSHESCYKVFAQLYPKSPLITQLIGVHSASEWLKKRREEVNYKTAKFTDPCIPWWFEQVMDAGVRRSVGEYLGDPLLFAFLDKHAMVAYPLAAALATMDSLSRLGITFSGQDRKSIAIYWRDSSGQLPGLNLLVP